MTFSSSLIDLLAYHFCEEPMRYQQFLTVIALASSTEQLVKSQDSILLKLAILFRNEPQVLGALNALLFKGYGLIVAMSPSPRPQIDRIIITVPDSESYIVDLDPELSPSSLLPFRTTSQIRSLATAASDDSFHETKFNDVEIEDASLVMELLQRELDRTHADTDASLRKKYLKTFRHLNRLHGVLPPSMYLRDITCESEFPVAGGGFSDVWIGRLDEQRVCVKVLRIFTQQENREVLLKTLNNEVLIWRQLKHPNILPFLGINTELFRPSYCIISPWMSNGDIISYTSKSELDLDAKLDYAAQIAQGLNYLHELDPPVVHGDIKGANILIADNIRQCCLADFGLSVMVTQSLNPTYSTAVQGSLRWLAPEFINPKPEPSLQGSKLTSRDIYAFGCTVVELLTGSPPFAHHKLDIHVAIDVLNGIRPKLPADYLMDKMRSGFIHSMLDSCWSEIISRRPTARELVELLPANAAVAITTPVPTQHRAMTVSWVDAVSVVEFCGDEVDEEDELFDFQQEDDSQEDLSETLPPPAKRGRGRPKGSKNKKSVTSITVYSGPKTKSVYRKSTSTTNNRAPKLKKVQSDEEPEAPKAKRKRGRPPKPKEVQIDAEPEEAKGKRGRVPKPKQVHSDAERDELPRRRLRRPPKPKQVHSDAELEDLLAMRKRGRAQLVEEEDTSSKRKQARHVETLSESDADEPQVKRKRGRPPKKPRNEEVQLPSSYAETSERRQSISMSSQLDPAFDSPFFGDASGSSTERHGSIWDEPSVLQAWTSYRQRQAVSTS